MNTESKNGYMLLFRGDEWYKNLSAEKLQEIHAQGQAWFKRLSEAGIAGGGNPLGREGKVVGKGGRVVDGPFAESKEVVGGYVLLNVASIDEAVAIAKECPGVAYGAQVEVRQVAAECPVAAAAAREAELAHA